MKKFGPGVLEKKWFKCVNARTDKRTDDGRWMGSDHKSSGELKK